MANDIKINSVSISNIKKGTSQIYKAYQGVNLVWDSGLSPSNFILDDYSSELAWSFRKLKTTATVSCRLRRSNDNAETDVLLTETGSVSLISIVSAGGSLGDWIGVNSGYVKTIYDQMVNGYDFTQTDTAKQPKLITSGVIELSNGLPAIIFKSTDILTGLEFDSAKMSLFSVLTSPTTFPNISYVFGNNGGGYAIGGTNSSYRQIFGISESKQVKGYTIRPSGQNLFEWYDDALFLNGAEDSPYTTYNPMLRCRFFALGARPDFTPLYFGGKFQEAIIYSTNESLTNRVTINSDLKTFYTTP